MLADLPRGRLREAASAVAHCIAGVLDQEDMARVLDELCAAADLRPGDRVKTLRGSAHGTILGIHSDGRVVWQPDGSSAELMALPEALLRVPAPPG